MNHLFIGLGGTGGRVIKAFKKLYFQSFSDPADAPKDLAIEYLWVDSDPKSFPDFDPSWTVLGKSLQLPKRSQLLIAQANLPSVVNELQSHPNLSPWLGNRDAWGEILSSLNVDAAGGQKRRLGRFLFAMSAARFLDSVNTLVSVLQSRNNSTAVTFHIFCGLAGGTGAGALIDTICQLRTKYPDQKDYRIMLYTYLPDLNPPARWDTGNYHANAYAALLELNALSAGAWAPFDVVTARGALPGNFWFNGCYIYSDNNDQGFRSTIDRELPDILADFVFHKTIIARRVPWPELHSFENSENGDSTPEAVAKSKKGQRSVRFLSFGIRRIAFPQETLREYLTFDFANQAFRQLQNNNWQDGIGYLELPKPSVDVAFVSDPKQRADWQLTDDHLRLGRPIGDSPSFKKWRPFDVEWGEFETHYLGLAQSGSEKLNWLPELKKLFAAAWSDNFRTSGVKNFYQSMRRDLKGLAEDIINRLEQDLFDRWQTGERSLNECGSVVVALIDDLEARAAKTDEFALKRENLADEFNRLFLEVEKKWPDMRFPGFSSRERDLQKAALLLRQQAVARTESEATRFAKDLLGNVIDRLVELRASLSAAETAVSVAAEQAMREVNARAPLPAQTGESQIQSYLTRIDDVRIVEATRRKLRINQDEQRTQTSEVRRRIFEALGQKPTFEIFSKRMAEADIRNSIIATCAENVKMAHQRLVAGRSEKIIDVSIIDKLKDQWGESQDRLNTEAAGLARSAGRFLVFDEVEKNKYFEGKLPAQRAVESFAVMLPMPADQKTFVTQLLTAFTNARAGGVKFIATDDHASEITLITLTNLFPLRFASLVRGLKQKYEYRMQQAGAERGSLEVHTEGDGTQFPDLFVPEGRILLKSAQSLLLLAMGCGVVKERPNSKDSKSRLILVKQDGDGIDTSVVLGSDLATTAEQLGESQIAELRNFLEAHFKATSYAAEAARDPVRAEIVARSAAVKDKFGDDIEHPDVIAWTSAAREAMAILRGEKML